MDNKMFGYIITAVFAFVDVILIIIPLMMTKSRNRKLQEYTLTAEAEVIKMDLKAMRSTYDMNRPKSRMWFPTYRYYVNGIEYIKESHVGTSEKMFEVGHTMKIKVDPNDHNKYILIESRAFKLAVTILWILAAFFALAVVASIVIIKMA